MSEGCGWFVEAELNRLRRVFRSRRIAPRMEVTMVVPVAEMCRYGGFLSRGCPEAHATEWYRGRAEIIVVKVCRECRFSVKCRKSVVASLPGIVI